MVDPPAFFFQSIVRKQCRGVIGAHLTPISPRRGHRLTLSGSNIEAPECFSAFMFVLRPSQLHEGIKAESVKNITPQRGGSFANVGKALIAQKRYH